MAKELVEAVEKPWSSTLTKNAALVVGATLLMGILVVSPCRCRSRRSTDPRKLRRLTRRTHTRQPPRIRRAYALSRRRCTGCAGICPQRALGRCSIARTNRRLPDLIPLRGFLAGWIAERGPKTFARYALASIAGEILLFVSGVSWIMVLLHAPLARAANFGLYPFIFAEVIKVLAAAELGRPPRVRHDLRIC